MREHLFARDELRLTVAIQIRQDHRVDTGKVALDPVLSKGALSAFHLLLKPSQTIAMIRAHDDVIHTVAVDVGNQNGETGSGHSSSRGSGAVWHELVVGMPRPLLT